MSVDNRRLSKSIELFFKDIFESDLENISKMSEEEQNNAILEIYKNKYAKFINSINLNDPYWKNTVKII